MPSLFYANTSFITYTNQAKNHTHDDFYRLYYNAKEKSCRIFKNDQPIPLIDPRYNTKKSPRSSYTCTSLQKEQYRSCKQLNTKRTTAVVLSYGVYSFTGLSIGFKEAYYRMDASLEIQCSKQKILF